MNDEPSQSPDGAAPRGKSLWVKVLLAVVPLLVLVALLEGTLWVLGLGADDSVPTVSRGFDPETAYLVRHESGWRTRLYGRLDLELIVPTKGERRRVVLVGGSNTQVFPDGFLQEVLDAGDPDDSDYEVLNMGRSGYGSGRVAILLEQALVLEPDVVVIYCGHNEFVERGLAAELERSMGGEAGQAAAGGLSRLRIYRQLEEAMRGTAPAEAVGDDVDPTLQQEASWERTEVYGAYERNLTRMVEASMAAGARVVLCTVVSNVFSPPYVSILSDELEPAARQRFENLMTRGAGRIPKRFRAGLEPPTRLRMPSWTTGTGVSLPDGLPELRPLFGPLADMPATPPERHDDASIEGRHWPPPEGWNQPVLALLQTMQALSERTLADGERESLRAAQGLLAQALKLAPDHPGALFELGLVTLLLGEDDDGARDLLARAAAADRSPHSGNDASNGKVRKLAAAHDDVILVDAAEQFAQRCPDGLVGYEVMMDACHMHPGARRVLMQDLARAILADASR
jgi:lysophospholipase L1-like esterase